MTKKELQDIIKELDIYSWELAREIGISESTYFVWIRADLTGERLERVLSAIERIKQKKKKVQ